MHTGEHVTATFWRGGSFVSEALTEIDYVLRDHRTGDVKPIDPELLLGLHRVWRALDGDAAFLVVSGYRSPKTNEKLRANGRGVAKRSFHTKGKAIDVRLEGRELSRLRTAAMSLNIGGVGYYPKSNFVHIDTGPVRRW